MKQITKSKALRQIKTLKGQLSALSRKASKVSTWESGKKSEFKFEDVQAERLKVSRQLVDLKALLAESNAECKVSFEDEKMSVQKAIFLLSELKDQISELTSLNLRNEIEEDYKRVVNPETGRMENVVFERKFESAMTEGQREEALTVLRDRVDALNDVLEAHNHSVKLGDKEE